MPAPRVAAAVLLVSLAAGCADAPAPPSSVARKAGLVQPAGAPIAAPSPPPRVVQRGDGRLADVPGGSAPSGPGETTTYVVEVEGGLGVDPAAFARQVEATLGDPRSWGSGGRRAMQRVGDQEEADLRVALASPELTDELCAPLETGGYFSCANGALAVLNVARWLQGAPSYKGHLADYQSYVVNHEVGHTLGFGHAECPGAGQVAPVMLQQTKGLEGCVRGPWPYP